MRSRRVLPGRVASLPDCHGAATNTLGSFPWQAAVAAARDGALPPGLDVEAASRNDDVDSGPILCTPAPWRMNFRNGIPVTVRLRGRRHELIGTLDDDAERVATVLRVIVGNIRAPW